MATIDLREAENSNQRNGFQQRWSYF